MPIFVIKSINNYSNAKWIVLSGLFLSVGSLILMPIIKIVLSITTIFGALLVLWGAILWIWSWLKKNDDVISKPTASSKSSAKQKTSSDPKIIVQKSDEK